ncbi:DUF1822 family protein [Tumidithrix elongata RA019]|uniref:DUF1822 family protein n=1 Tax=Tumidithrix elongata BACA0141 TaxID=2716417 RepID=A0AAW9PUW8_9CYAN|nr:DUF1822 family protein [Tumidithrix elongata RA019]
MMLTARTRGMEDIFEFEALHPDEIEICESDVMKAARIGSWQPPEQQWQIYLKELASIGIKQWLRTRIPKAVRPFSHVADCEVISLQVGDFKVCVIPTFYVNGFSIEFPSVIVDIPDRSYHFYIVAEVREEHSLVRFCGFLSHPQLVDLQQRGLLEKADGNRYVLPLGELDRGANKLLLYLQCLEDSAIAIATPPTLTSPSQHSFLNLALWLKGDLDELTRSLEWMLLPKQTFALRESALRSIKKSPIDELGEFLRKWESQTNATIPADARAAYQDLVLGDAKFRLYAIPWVINSETENPEWSLLLVLSAIADDRLPLGLTLSVRDRDRVLFEQIGKSNTVYLHAQVIGNWNETFSVKISLPSGLQLTLPEFGFYPYV